MYDFAANKDDKYLELLRIAKFSDNTEYSSSQLKNIMETLNCLHDYKHVHKRIIPLLKYKAQKLNIFHLLSADIQDLLNKETQKAVIAELAQKSQLSKLISVFAEQNIPIILLKGSAFANSIYHIKAPRTSNDIDILVKQNDWEKAKKTIGTIMDLLPIKNKQVFDNLYETSFIPKGKTGAAVDLHKSLIHPYLFNIDEDELWLESIKHSGFNSELVRTLSVEHTLIHQAIHAFKDMDFSKYNLIDVHEIMQQKQPDLVKTFEISKKWGCNIPVFVLLSNCCQIMKTITTENNLILQTYKLNMFNQLLCKQILKSKTNDLTTSIKTYRYRLLQFLSQFAFTGSFKRPISLQWMYFQTMMKKAK